jgi:hypothetical protein
MTKLAVFRIRYGRVKTHLHSQGQKDGVNLCTPGSTEGYVTQTARDVRLRVSLLDWPYLLKRCPSCLRIDDKNSLSDGGVGERIRTRFFFRLRTIREFALWVKGKDNAPCCGIAGISQWWAGLLAATCAAQARSSLLPIEALMPSPWFKTGEMSLKKSGVSPHLFFSADVMTRVVNRSPRKAENPSSPFRFRHYSDGRNRSSKFLLCGLHQLYVGGEGPSSSYSYAALNRIALPFLPCFCLPLIFLDRFF